MANKLSYKVFNKTEKYQETNNYKSSSIIQYRQDLLRSKMQKSAFNS